MGSEVCKSHKMGGEGMRGMRGDAKGSRAAKRPKDGCPRVNGGSTTTGGRKIRPMGRAEAHTWRTAKQERPRGSAMRGMCGTGRRLVREDSDSNVGMAFDHTVTRPGCGGQGGRWGLFGAPFVSPIFRRPNAGWVVMPPKCESKKGSRRNYKGVIGTAAMVPSPNDSRAPHSGSVLASNDMQ